jgi:pimeloyl-ACP methyl ester carboxylesterase
MGTSVDDLQALVNHLQLERFHLVGSAAGGFIVPDYAVSHPDRLLSMTIACSTGGAIDEEYRKVFLTIRTPEIVELPHWIKELGPSYRAANPEGVAAWIALEEKSVHQLIRPAAKNDLHWHAYEQLDVPVLLMGADADVYMPPPMLRELASHLHDPEVVILTESGHSGYWEQPDAFNRTLIDFLRRHSRGDE